MSGKTKGQALVEFAISLPILIFLITLLVEASFCFHAIADLHMKARELARQAAKGHSFFNDLMGVEECIVFANARYMGMGTDAYSVRIAYVEMAMVDGEVISCRVESETLGDESRMPKDIDEGLIHNQQIVADRYGITDDKAAIWAVVDVVKDYEPIIWVDVWPVREIVSRSVFRVTYHLYRGETVE